jgi:hypothetical protein
MYYYCIEFITINAVHTSKGVMDMEANHVPVSLVPVSIGALWARVTVGWLADGWLHGPYTEPYYSYTY